MVIRHSLFLLAAGSLMLLAAANPAFAQAAAAGGNLVSTFEDAITGNIGFFIGLAVTLIGLWTWIIKQETGAGIVMIIGGVLITLVPDIFDGMTDVVRGVVTQFSGS